MSPDDTADPTSQNSHPSSPAQHAAPAQRARLRELWPLLAPERRALAIGFLLSLLSSAAAVGQPIAMMFVINATLADRPLAAPLTLLAALLFLDVGLTALQSWVTLRAGESIVLAVRERLIGRILFWPAADYRSHRRGDIVSRVGTDAAMLRSVIADGTVDIAGSALTLIGGIIVMITIDWVLFAVSAGVIAAAAIVVWGFLIRITAATEVAQTHVGTLAAELDRTLTGSLTMVLSGARALEAQRLLSHASAAAAAGRRAAGWEALVAPALMFGSNLAFLAVFGLGGVRVAAGQVGIGEFVSFVLYFGVLVTPLFSSFQALSTLQRALGSLRRITALLDAPIDDAEAPVTGGTAAAEAPVSGEDTAPGTQPRATGFPVRDRCPPPRVRCAGVRFGYRPDRPVLTGLDLTVEPGSWLALTGPSGTGKTTLLHLIAGIESPQAGQVLVDDVPVASLAPAARRQLIACVLQEAPVFWGTLRENLTYGLTAAPAEATLLATARAAGLEAMLKELPAGLDTRVDEDGVSLSGGQRQRISLARALLRRPGLLLLDEPTSQLDARAEHQVLATLKRLRGETTIIMTAHRASTAAAADAVIDLGQLQD